jgi:hypothetical protein
MTRFSYGARLHTIRSAAIQRVQRPGISQWRRAGERPCNLVLHTSRREFCSVDVPSNLTGNLPHESSALGQEALPPRDPRGRGPGGDLCIALSVSVARSRSSASDGELRTVAGIEADDEACDVLALRNVERGRADVRTRLLLHVFRHGGGRVSLNWSKLVRPKKSMIDFEGSLVRCAKKCGARLDLALALVSVIAVGL